MSHKVTEASRKRMEARENFVSLNPGYVTIENRISNEPVLDIVMTGHRDSKRVAEQIMEVLETHFKYSLQNKLVVRQTA